MIGAWTLLVISAAANPLAAAEQAFASKRYADVLPALTEARSAPLSDSQKRRAFELEAMTDAAFGDSPHAIEAFEGALEVDPTYHPAAEVSPKVRGLFDEAHRRFLIAHPPAPPETIAVHPASPPAVAEESGPPVWKTWWFWTAAGVVVAGTAGAVIYAKQPRFPTGSLGRDTLP